MRAADWLTVDVLRSRSHRTAARITGSAGSIAGQVTNERGEIVGIHAYRDTRLFVEVAQLQDGGIVENRSHELELR